MSKMLIAVVTGAVRLLLLTRNYFETKYGLRIAGLVKPFARH